MTSPVAGPGMAPEKRRGRAFGYQTRGGARLTDPASPPVSPETTGTPEPRVGGFEPMERGSERCVQAEAGTADGRRPADAELDGSRQHYGRARGAQTHDVITAGSGPTRREPRRRNLSPAEALELGPGAPQKAAHRTALTAERRGKVPARARKTIGAGPAAAGPVPFHKLPGARGARPGQAALPDVDRRRDRRRTGRPPGHPGGRWLTALLAAALPLFSGAQLLDGPSPWDVAWRVWVVGLVILLLAIGIGARVVARRIRRPPGSAGGQSA